MRVNVLLPLHGAHEHFSQKKVHTVLFSSLFSNNNNTTTMHLTTSTKNIFDFMFRWTHFPHQEEATVLREFFFVKNENTSPNNITPAQYVIIGVCINGCMTIQHYSALET